MWILKRLENHPIASITLLVLLMLGLHLEVIPVSIMEARNFITAREMITNDNWLLTTMNGEPRYQKPPIPSLICALFASIFGISNLIAYRLPAILLVMLTGVFSYVMSRQLNLSNEHSFRNALILITSFYVIGITFEAPSDIFTHGFMLVAISQLFFIFNRKVNLIKPICISSLFIGLSILSKGPVSFYALLLPFLIAYGFTYHYRFSKQQILSFVTVIVLASVIGGSWYAYVRLNDPQTFLAIAEKETGNWTSYNVRPFYYYWSFFVQSGIWTIPAFIGLLYPYMKSRVSNLKAYQFTLIWTLAAVILLSIIPEKKSRYLMPVLIPLALNTGFYIEFLILNFQKVNKKIEKWPVYFNFGLIAVLALSFPVIAYLFLTIDTTSILATYIYTSIIVLIIGSYIIKYLYQQQLKYVFYLTLAFFISLSSFGIPLAKALQSEEYIPISKLRQELLESEIKVFRIGELAPEIIWEYGGIIPELQEPNSETIGIISTLSAEEIEQKIEANYILKSKKFYNLNFSDPNTKSYKDRLTANFFLFERTIN